MNQLLRKVARKVVGLAGLELRRRVEGAFPYRLTMKAGGYEFPFWIASETGRMWYAKHAEIQPEHDEIEDLTNLVKPGERVLEVGTHHGFYSMLLSYHLGKHGRLIGIEADPENALVAQAQVTLNGMAPTNCQIINAAAADAPGEIYISKFNNQIALRENDECVKIDAVTMDSLIVDFGTFDVIKMDIEGYEGAALRGCQRLLAQRPKIALELHLNLLESFGESVGGVLAHFPESVYEGYFRDGEGRKVPFSHEGIRRSTAEKLMLYLTPRHFDGQES